MSSTLPSLAPGCCTPDCEDPVSVAVPGPAGDDGEIGAAGAAGAAAYTTFSAAFTMPAELGSAVATLTNTSWLAVNQIVYGSKSDGSVMGTFQVTAIGGATSATLKNLEDTATGAYPANSAPGSIFTIGSMLVPAGVQGPTGTSTGTTMTGDVTGTIGANLITKNATLGSTLVGNGTSAQALGKGTDGQLLVTDAAAALDLTWKSLLPNTGATDLADNRIPRFDGATGLPVPLQSSLMGIADDGALQIGYGNVKGAGAVDLQTNHTAVTQVASGAQATIAGGLKNTGSGAQSAIGGGDTNLASGVAATVGGGAANQATRDYSTVSGGNSNQVTGLRGTVGGGIGNLASGADSTIGGGTGGIASATSSTVAGGSGNQATQTGATVAGGSQGIASGISSTVGGGNANEALADNSHINGGFFAKADKYGQEAWASGGFSLPGDAQGSKVVMRRATADATPTELFLDGATLRLVVPSGASWMFQIMLVARRSDGLTSIYKSEGIITNIGNTVTMPAVATTTEIYDGIGLPATPVAVTADDPNNALIITCTGVAANAIRWVANVHLVEVGYP